MSLTKTRSQGLKKSPSNHGDLYYALPGISLFNVCNLRVSYFNVNN